jgi:hypothetical protein
MDDVKDLTLLGVLGMIDPPREPPSRPCASAAAPASP